VNSEPPHLLDRLFTTDQVREIFSNRRRVQSMLDFEAALARALARAGISSKEASRVIESQCRAELYDFERLATETALAGTIAIPLVRQLTELVARQDKTASGFVHLGATSQDVMDTGLVLQLRDACDAIGADLAKLSSAIAQLVETRGSIMLSGRTLLQQAPPITLGLKAAGWLDAVERHRERLRETRRRALVLQFGGAVGTVAALQEKGLEVAAAIADELKLPLPVAPWHAHRDRFAEVAAAVGLLTGTLGKVARDIALLAQTEIGELAEPAAPGRGGSSAMPHKRNPVGCAVVLAAAIRVPSLVATMLAAMVQEHERGLGGWQAEWETLPQICELAAGALAHLRCVIEGLEVHEDRMRSNLELSRGLIFSEAIAVVLAQRLGRSRAREIVEQACLRALQQPKHLREALLEERDARSHLTDEELDRLFDSRNYLGVAKEFVDRVLAARRTRYQ
jgi:3-carboxy-cis,cis-muconate cycloisomerase